MFLDVPTFKTCVKAWITAIVILSVVLYQKRLQEVKMMTKRKLTDFSLAKEKYGSPVIFRELAFIQSHFTNVMNKKTTDYNSIRLLLNDWDRINKTYDVWSDENEEIRKLMRIDGHLLSKRLKSMGRYVTADKDIYTNLIMLARVANPPNINPKEISIDDCF